MKRIAASLAAIAAICSAVIAQQPPPAPATHKGVASCVHSGCHGSTEPLGATRVLQNEYFTWLNSDGHSRAYNILFSERSARIARNMSLTKKAWEESVCLDCHTTNVQGVDAEDGVQCEACHGPADGWRDGHSQRGWTHEKSVAAGMIDLRSITRRAALCAGCHVGDAGREVDHELIASGHPPLVFELDNYTASMPPHWRPGKPGHGVEAWATGQVVTFRQSLANLGRHARGEKWPEFSDMNCGACHHSLAASAWRQERGWSGRAGLPPWSGQRWIVLRPLIERVAPRVRAALDPVIAELAAAVSRMNSDAVVEAAQRAEKMVLAVQPQITTVRWTDKDLRSLMLVIAAVEAADAQEAEQIALSLQSLSAALTRRDPRLLRSPLISAIDGLFDELQKPAEFDPQRFAARLATVRKAQQP